MTKQQLNYLVDPVTAPLHGHIKLPGDKSISHRALILGALAEGTTEIINFLEAEDTLVTLQALEQMGVNIERLPSGALSVHGVGLHHGLQAPKAPLVLGNSGTGLRLLSGVLAGQAFDSELTGDESLLRRPMGRIVHPLREMGANIEMQPDETAPLIFHGGQTLKGIRYAMPVASAQVKSAVLLAGLQAEGETEVLEPASTRDHTERMLRAFGYTVKRHGPGIRVAGQKELIGTSIEVPGDMSAAAFFIVAASLIEGSDILLEAVGINPYRIGLLNILRVMGAKIEVGTDYLLNEEPVADLRVQASTLRGVDIPMDQVALAIDEFPILFIAAACAKGVTTLRGAQELRVKESDRILAMANGLRNLGINAEALPDGITIEGGRLRGGRVQSYGDHRIAMAFAIAGLVIEGEVVVEDCAAVNTSFPSFISLANRLGANIRTEFVEE